jgi:hypothetical protein
VGHLAIEEREITSPVPAIRAGRRGEDHGGT